MKDAIKTQTPIQIGSVQDLLKPTIVFYSACLIFYLFPSYNFNADSLHYTILGYLGAHNFNFLFFDVSTPVHFSWHVLTTLLIKISGPRNLLHSLYVLRVANITFALIYIYLFMRFLQLYADNFTTFIATSFLAFSNAYLTYALAVEVYTLSNIFILFNFYFLFSLANGTIKPGLMNMMFLGTLSFLAVLSHITNALLLLTTAIYFLSLRKTFGFKPLTIYLCTFSLLFAGLITLFSIMRGTDFVEGLKYYFHYSNVIQIYTSSNFFSNLVNFIVLIPELFFVKFGVLFLPCAIFSIFFVMKQIKPAWEHPFTRFLILYLLLNFLFFSQWDVTQNIKLKIIFIPAVLMFLSHLSFQSKTKPGTMMKGLLVTTLLILFLVNMKFNVLHFSSIENGKWYSLSAKIRKETNSPKVLLIGLGSLKNISAIVPASIIFFGQEVALLSREEPGLEKSIVLFREKEFDVLDYRDGTIKRFQ